MYNNESQLSDSSIINLSNIKKYIFIFIFIFIFMFSSSKERMETNYQRYSKENLVKLLIKRDAEVDKTVDLLRRNDVSLSSLFEDVEEYVIDVFDNVLEGKIESMMRCLDDMHL